MDEIINKVAKSGLITLDLEDFCDIKTSRSTIDIADILFQGMILRETDIRNFIKETSWEQYRDHYVNIVCSADAIVPIWAYMLITSSLHPFAKKIISGTIDELNFQIFQHMVNQINFEEYQDKKIVIKGCGDFNIPDSCYTLITDKLLPFASSIMYGEPCSTVPVYKKKKNIK